MWSVPVVSAWISRSFGILSISSAKISSVRMMRMSALAHFASASAGSSCGMEAQRGQGRGQPLGEECRVAAFDQYFG